MSTNKDTKINVTKNSGVPVAGEHKLFSKDNYIWMAIGLAVMILGYVLMAGGKSEDPNVFNESEIYGFQRITLAPILIVAGLVIEIYAIIKKPRH